MAITFPRDFPEPAVFELSDFDLDDNVVVSPTRGKTPDAAGIGPSLWRANFTTDILNPQEFAVWDSWLRSMRSGQKLFKAWPGRYEFPSAYPDGWGSLQIAMGGGPFTGQAVLDAVGGGNDTIDLSGLPDGFTLNIGDFLAFTYDTSRRALHEVQEQSIADANGDMTVTVEPLVQPGTSGAEAVDLEKPWALMFPVKGSRSVENVNSFFRKLSFSAQQTDA